MKKSLFVVLVVSVCLVAVYATGRILGHDQAQAVPGTKPGHGPRELSPGAVVTADLNFGRMPLYFIPNQGQMDKRVSFYVRGRDKSIYFGPGQVTFSLLKPPDEASEKTKSLTGRVGGRDVPLGPLERWIVRLEFVGANQQVRPVGEDKTGAVVSYFKGRPEDWKTGLDTYYRIIYRDLWPGIDLAYSGTVNRLKYEFIVHPGADPSMIRLRYRGAENIAVNADGRLEVETPVASFRDETPHAWQDVGGVRHEVRIFYDLAVQPKEPGGEHAGEFSFNVGRYDPALPLVLDPSVLVYCGYIGGEAEDMGQAICVDSNGNAYVAGATISEETFPVRVGPDLNANGDYDAFVAKVNATGTSLIYCGYVGGSGTDFAKAIAINDTGSAYIAGKTDSDETTFPVRIGPDVTYNGSPADAFVARINASGTSLIYCGYIGGHGNDDASGIAVDAKGRACVCGVTETTDSSFPVIVGPDLTYNGMADAFVARVYATGSGLSYCGYIGGVQADAAHGIAVDSAGNCYVAGETRSTEATFPVLVGPDLTHNGNDDAFVAKVHVSGIGLVYCGYIGGAADDEANGIALDNSGYAYVAGVTSSDELSFPTFSGPDLTHNGSLDAFVARVYASGIGLYYCGYIGGAGEEYGDAIAVDSRGCAHVVGVTTSDQTTFPVRGGPQTVFGGCTDAYIARVGATGRGLSYCGYIGGAGNDSAWAVAVDAKSNAYISGYAESEEWNGFPVLVGPDLTHNGVRDAFVAKVRLIPELTIDRPVGFERWVVGSVEKIEWTTEDKKGYNTIECSTDKGQTWFVVAASTPDDGSFLWTIPNTPSEACLIKITQKESGQFDQSDQPFAIVPKPKITVTSPNGGESWTGYSQHFIQWTTKGTVGDVKIEYSKDAGAHWIVVVAQTPNTGSYMWVVPNTPSTKCLVRIKEAADGVPADKSNALFRILPAAD